MPLQVLSVGGSDGDGKLVLLVFIRFLYNNNNIIIIIIIIIIIHVY